MLWLVHSESELEGENIQRWVKNYTLRIYTKYFQNFIWEGYVISAYSLHLPDMTTF